MHGKTRFAPHISHGDWFRTAPSLPAACHATAGRSSCNRPCAGAPSPNSHAPSRIFSGQTGCCKPGCFRPSRHRASNHRSEDTPSRRIPRLARRQPASSCQPQPASQTDTDIDHQRCNARGPSQSPRQRHSTTTTPSARTPRCSIWGCGICQDSARVPFSRIMSVAAAVGSPARNDSPTCTGIRGR